MKKKYFFYATLWIYVVFSTQIMAQSWVQIGQDLSGDAADDLFGMQTAVNYDGSVVAVSSKRHDHYRGQVKVFRNVSGTWVQMGSDLAGDNTGDGFGVSIALSADGNRLVVGAYDNGGNGTHSGQVKVFDFDPNAGAWQQVGSDIYGEGPENYAGRDVSVSDDGTTIAVSAPYNDNAGTDRGQVRVFRFNGSAWVQLGSSIYGSNDDDRIGNVSLSSDGTVLAVGTPGNDNYANYAGQVRVFQWDGSAWTQLGSDIYGVEANEYAGSVSLSDDGMTLAVGARGNDTNGTDAGQVRIYHYNGTDWVQLGSAINGEAAGDWSGEHVSLSGDGTRVAIGAFRNNDGGAWAGHVRVFEYNGTDWSQLGNDIDGIADNDGLGQSVGLSGDGSVVIAGSPRSDNNGSNSGAARVFGYSSMSVEQLSGKDIVIYPNPNDGVFRIRLSEFSPDGSIIIYDETGKKVKQILPGGKEEIVNMRLYPKGVYFIKIKTGENKLKTYKILLK